MNQQPILTIFGGSSPNPGQASYAAAQKLGELAAQSGWRVATGGYSGTMEAASRGAAEAGGEAIGVTCQQIEQWRPLGPNRWVSREIRCETLRDRLEKLVDLGDAAIALPGGIGTLAEVALMWSWLQTSVIDTKPLVLVGSGWRQTLDVFLSSFEGYVAEDYVGYLYFAEDVERAWRMTLELVGDARD
ncbi:MAG: LOG family protein [Anaerolineales bacterium]